MVRLLQTKQQKRTVSLLSTFAIATFGLHLLTLLLFLQQGLTIRQLSSRKPPTFVQLINGQPVVINDDLERSPEAIRQFISKTMTLMFNWSGTLPPQNIEEVTKPKTDSGIMVQIPKGGSKKVTTSSWIASFALSEDFRKGFLLKIAEMTPPEVFSNNPNQALSAELRIKRIYPPQQIAPGQWRVGMVADIIQKKRNNDGEVVIPFNKDFLVQAVDYFAYPLANHASDLSKVIYSVRADQLEIYEIRNLCLLDDYSNSNDNQSQQCKNQLTSPGFTN